MSRRLFRNSKVKATRKSSVSRIVAFSITSTIPHSIQQIFMSTPRVVP